MAAGRAAGRGAQNPSHRDRDRHGDRDSHMTESAISQVPVTIYATATGDPGFEPCLGRAWSRDYLNDIRLAGGPTPSRPGPTQLRAADSGS